MDKCDFRYCQSNVRWLLPASDYCRALLRCLHCAQRFDYHALGSCRKLGGAAEHLIDGSEKRNYIVGRALNFRVRMLLKHSVTIPLMSDRMDKHQEMSPRCSPKRRTRGLSIEDRKFYS